MAARNEELFNVEQAAGRLAIKPKTLRNWIGDRKIGVARISPRCVRIPSSEIDRILERAFTPAREDRAF